MEAEEAGRDGGLPADAREVVELERDNPGRLGSLGPLNMKELGGATSFFNRRVALLFDLGAMVGAVASDATEIVSLLLCPGTPSKPSLALFSEPVDGLRSVVGGLIPNLSAAALVILGAIAGAAVDATEMVSARLWPGIFSNVLASRSLLRGLRGETFSGMAVPARSCAARVVRGTMSGLSCVDGTLRARKADLLFDPDLTLPEPLVGLVTFEVLR